VVESIALGSSPTTPKKKEEKEGALKYKLRIPSIAGNHQKQGKRQGTDFSLRVSKTENEFFLGEGGLGYPILVISYDAIVLLSPQNICNNFNFHFFSPTFLRALPSQWINIIVCG
jgi:hypothetical protein